LHPVGVLDADISEPAQTRKSGGVFGGNSNKLSYVWHEIVDSLERYSTL